MIVRIIGSGCANCAALEAATRTALDQLGVRATVDHITDHGQIAAYGVMSTPALAADGQLLVAGRVPGVAEIASLLAAHLSQS